MLSLITAAGIVSAATFAYGDDPVERSAERAADAKKDNKPKHDRPQEEPQADRKDAGDTGIVKPDRVVEPKAAHGDKVVPAQTGPVRIHRHRHHRAIDSDKRLHDPTDALNR